MSVKKKCIDCEYFKIVQQPLEDHWDTGMARCLKYDLVVDFYNNGKLKRLECTDWSNYERKA